MKGSNIFVNIIWWYAEYFNFKLYKLFSASFFFLKIWFLNYEITSIKSCNVWNSSIMMGLSWSNLSCTVWQPSRKALAPSNLTLVNWSPPTGTWSLSNSFAKRKKYKKMFSYISFFSQLLWQKYNLKGVILKSSSKLHVKPNHKYFLYSIETN